MAISPANLTEAMASWAGAVSLVTVADGRDDVGATVSALCPVSQEPPLVMVSLMASSYPAEVLGSLARSFAVTLLASDQRMLAGRFAAEGRPAARHMLADVPHARGPRSGALIPSEGLAALECVVEQLVPAGDHLLVLARVLDIPYLSQGGTPLIRFRHRYLTARLPRFPRQTLQPRAWAGSGRMVVTTSRPVRASAGWRSKVCAWERGRG